MEARAMNDGDPNPSRSQTPERDKLLAKARECPRCTITPLKPGQTVATFLNAEALEQVKCALGTQDRKKP